MLTRGGGITGVKNICLRRLLEGACRQATKSAEAAKPLFEGFVPPPPQPNILAKSPAGGGDTV